MLILPEGMGRSALATLPLAFLLSLASDAPVATSVQLDPERRPVRAIAVQISPSTAGSPESHAPVPARSRRGGRTAVRNHAGAARPGSAAAQAPNADCWLWPGASSRRGAEKARVYVLQGHFYRNGRFEAQGSQPGRTPREGRELVPVYRMDRLPANGVLQAVAALVMDAWRRRGWQVPGVQVDFNSPTAKLDRYARWIRLENERFGHSGMGGITPVTGLGDRLVSGRPADLRALDRAAGVILSDTGTFIPAGRLRRTLAGVPLKSVPPLGLG